MILIVLFVLLGIEFLVGLKNPKYSIGFFVTIVFLIPNSVKISLGMNLNSFNLAVLVMIFLLIPLMRKSQSLYPRIQKIFIAYSIYIAITSLISSIGLFPFSEYVQNMILFLFEYGLLMYCMCWASFSNKEIKCFNIILVSVTIIVIIYGFITYFIHFNPYITYINLIFDVERDMIDLFMEEQRGILDGRITSTFYHPLHLGQFVVIVFSYLFFELLGRVNRFFYILLLFALFTTSFLTGSRSSMIPLLLIPIIYLFYNKPHTIIRYSLIGIIGLTLFFPAMPQNVQDYVEGVVFFWDDNATEKADISGSSASSRSEQLVAGIGHLGDDLLIGKGTNYHIKHAEEYSDDMYGYESIFLSHLIDGGILGIIVFLLFYFQLYIFLLKNCRNSYDKSRAHALCLSFFISICLTGIVYSFFCIFLVFYMITLARVCLNKDNADNLLCVADSSCRHVVRHMFK